MLILEIAAGIVLGVLALAFLPQLLKAAVWLAAIAIALTILAVVAFFVVAGWPESLYVLAGIGAIGLFLVWTHQSKRFDMRFRWDDEKGDWVETEPKRPARMPPHHHDPLA
jgi:hypothetical protein